MKLLLFMATFGGPPRAPQDSWFGRDKLAHFAVSAVVQGAAHAALRSVGNDYAHASRGAAVVTLTVGVGKELWDRKRGGDASVRDLAWDSIGGITGAVAARQVDR
jgi:putative lipoprotein